MKYSIWLNVFLTIKLRTKRRERLCYRVCYFFVVFGVLLIEFILTGHDFKEGNIGWLVHHFGSNIKVLNGFLAYSTGITIAPPGG